MLSRVLSKLLFVFLFHYYCIMTDQSSSFPRQQPCVLMWGLLVSTSCVVVLLKDPMTLNKVYCNTTSMKLHSIHPSLVNLQPVIQQEKEAAEMEFSSRVQPLVQFTLALRSHIDARESTLCRSLLASGLSSRLGFN